MMDIKDEIKDLITIQREIYVDFVDGKTTLNKLQTALIFRVY